MAGTILTTPISSSGDCFESPSEAEGSWLRSTTPPTSVSSISSPSTDYDGKSTSLQLHRFLSNLDNYLALGCLCLEDPITETDLESTTIWQEIPHSAVSLPSRPALEANLSKLVKAGWVRLCMSRSYTDRRTVILRIYLLPADCGNKFVDRQSKKLSMALENVIPELDISPETWFGAFEPTRNIRFDRWATKQEDSLFYTFNKISSPRPDPALVKTKYEREALEDILDPNCILSGLRTNLYPYQRRSAGLMLQREAVAELGLDPRLEPRTAPDGTIFYYNAWDGDILRHPRYYESCHGGILAESMGLGKTIMCLALILATKHHLPRIPPQYNTSSIRRTTGSLADMAVSQINRTSLPWKVEFERIEFAHGEQPSSCRDRLESQPPQYEVPFEPARWNRWTKLPPPRTVFLAATTIIVVPRNLFKQWRTEIEKHTDSNALRIMYLEHNKDILPKASELRTYDVILFSRNRFECEINDGSDEQGRRLASVQLKCCCPYIGATRQRDCTCPTLDDLYDSPLKYVHVKRLIIDEGHFSANMNTTAVAVANRLVVADHRWIVSGTPAKDLLGVEVDTSAAENLWHAPQSKSSRDTVLGKRKRFNPKEDTSGAIKCLGSFATNFLRIKPWAASADGLERPSAWDDYVFRHEAVRKRTYSAFSNCLSRTLEAMIIKTQPDDVERDIELPPLSHEVVRLRPSFYDKLTANLFNLVLTANAITSERTDADYLFHKNSTKARIQLIQNLRQSAFCWTGFSEGDVLASLKNGNGYLNKENTGCTEADRVLLESTMACTDPILGSPGWMSLSRSHELGFFVNDWPDTSAAMWTFDGSTQPLLTGISQLLEAQKHVSERVSLVDPSESLAGLGIKATASTRIPRAAEGTDEGINEKPVLTRSGIPLSSIDGEPSLKRRTSFTGSSPKSPKRLKLEPQPKIKAKKKRTSTAHCKDESSPGPVSSPNTQPSTPAKLNKPTRLPSRSPLAKTRIVGTTSAKLSYLISQVLKYAHDEKMLIFYDGDNVAYYIAQALELFDIKHEIYAKSLKVAMKAEYVVRFNKEPSLRVLLMDVKQAAYGLNLCSASRIYFVNPVCRPNIEAQAIKRAHRIGQTRKVYAETLVLRDSIEEKMMERAKQMTRAEHNDAKALEDDGGIRKIIQDARVLPIYDHERQGYGQMAPLEEPQPLWRSEPAVGLDRNMEDVVAKVIRLL